MSSLDAFDRVLRETLEDLRLSRSERRALRQVVEEMAPDEQERQVMTSRAFAIAEEALTSETDRKVVQWLRRTLSTLAAPSLGEEQDPEAWFGPDPKLVARLLELLTGARVSVDICVFTITDDRLSRAIESAHERGVRVRLLTDDDKSFDLGSDIARLTDRGIPVALDHSPAHMHHKFALFDARTLVTGSYNWTRSAASDNQENFLVTSDPRLLTPFAEEFERLWRVHYRGS